MKLTAVILEFTSQSSDTPSSFISNFFLEGGKGEILWKIFFQIALKNVLP